MTAVPAASVSAPPARPTTGARIRRAAVCGLAAALAWLVIGLSEFFADYSSRTLLDCVVRALPVAVFAWWARSGRRAERFVGGSGLVRAGAALAALFFLPRFWFQFRLLSGGLLAAHGDPFFSGTGTASPLDEGVRLLGSLLFLAAFVQRALVGVSTPEETAEDAARDEARRVIREEALRYRREANERALREATASAAAAAALAAARAAAFQQAAAARPPAVIPLPRVTVPPQAPIPRVIPVSPPLRTSPPPDPEPPPR